MKRYLVVGMARSGVAAALLLAKKGFQVRINDSKPLGELGEALDCLKGYENVEWRLGMPAVEAMDGVDEMIVSPGISVESALVKAAEEKGIAVTGELELGYRMTRGDLLAITGTNGKTTTTTLLGEIMKNAGKTTHVVGNIGIPYTSVAFDSKDEDVTVCEVSSFQMETAREFHPVISAILNLTPDHLNRHHTMENYLAMKKRVFANQAGESEWLVLNYDDPALRPVAEEAKCRVAWFSRKQVPPYGAFVKDGAMVFGTRDEYRTVCEAAEIYIPGPHNLENAMAAAVMALLYGVPVPAYIAHLPGGGTPHRVCARGQRGALHQRLQGHQRRLHHQGGADHDPVDCADPGRLGQARGLYRAVHNHPGQRHDPAHRAHRRHGRSAGRNAGQGGLYRLRALRLRLQGGG